MHPSCKIASMVAGGIPPTVSIGTEAALTARSALMATAGMIPAGKSLRECAPAWMVAKASVGVATPGSQTRPAARVAAATPGARFLAAISLPSGFAAASRSVAASTVRAPDDHAGSESCTPRGDAPRRGGRVQRHLDQGKASPDQFTNMGQRLFRADAPQDSHQQTGLQRRGKHEDQISRPRFAI